MRQRTVQVPSAKYQVPSVKDQVPRTKDLKPKPQAQNLKPKAYSPTPNTHHPARGLRPAEPPASLKTNLPAAPRPLSPSRG